jgi:hypothetical protein
MSPSSAHPNVYRARIIWRMPNLGPQVELLVSKSDALSARVKMTDVQVCRENGANKIEADDNEARISDTELESHWSYSSNRES